MLDFDLITIKVYYQSNNEATLMEAGNKQQNFILLLLQ